MNIDRLVLKEALEIVKPGLASKDIIEQSTSFVFYEGKVITYNDEISISHPVEGLDNIEGVVSSEELYKFLSKSKSQEILIEASKESLLIKSGRAKVILKLIEDISLPIEEEILREVNEKSKWEKLPEEFVTGLKFAAQSCSKDMTNLKTTCVHINSKGVIEGTDNYRLAHYSFDKPFKIKTSLIPASSVIEIVKLNPSYVLQGEDWCHFKTENGTIISSRVFYENFVDTSDVLNISKGGHSITFPKKILEILERSDIFSKRKSIIDESVEVSFAPGVLRINSENEAGKFTESTKFEYKGEKMSFSITPYLLKDILKKITKCKINDYCLHFEGGNWKYVTTLRTSEE